MARFNDGLPAGSVVVGIDDRYNDNDGAYHLAHVWDGQSVIVHNYANGYNKGAYYDAEVNATVEQKMEAAEWWRDNCKETENYWDCVVVLQRSRKAPNKVPLKVVSYDAGGYNGYYNQHDPEQIQVEIEKDADYAWVNASCVKQVIKGRDPFWAPKEQ